MRSIPRSQNLSIVFMAVIVLLTGCYSSNRQEKEFAANISDQKVNEFLSSVKKVDGSVEAKYRMARYFQKRKRHKIALEELKEIIHKDPTFVKAYNAMGISYESLGDFNKAIHSYELALKISPNLDYVLNNLGFAYLLRENYDMAIDAFQKAIVLDPNFSRAYFSQGVSYGQLGEYPKAIAQINTALKMEPQNGMYYYGRGRVYLMWGDKTKAMDDFKKAAELGDEDALNYMNYIGEGKK